jgi:hypothetical protein
MGQCRSWVISGQTIAGQNRPLSAIPQKRTNAGAVGLSAKCQKRTNADAAELSAKCQKRTSGQTFLDERSYPDDVPVPSFGPRLRCERCGYAGALRVDHGVSANRPHMLTG